MTEQLVKNTEKSTLAYVKKILQMVPYNGVLGRAMAQTVSRRPLTAEARFAPRICGAQSCSGTGLFSEFFSFPCQCHSTVDLHTHISPGG
jgi:hypothetical protein